MLFIVPIFLSATTSMIGFTPMMQDTYGSVNGTIFAGVFFIVFINTVCPPNSLGAYTIITQVKNTRTSFSTLT